MCAVAVIARRQNEGTHPINKTTRVTIEFNREKNGFQSTKRLRGTREGRRGIPEVNPQARMRYYCLLFRTSIPNGWSAGLLTRRRERMRMKEWEEGRKGRKTVFANVAPWRNSFSHWDERHMDFAPFFGDNLGSTVTFTTSEGTVARKEVDFTEIKSFWSYTVQYRWLMNYKNTGEWNRNKILGSWLDFYTV